MNTATVEQVSSDYIVQNLPHYVFWKDTESVFMGCNQNFATLFGLDSPEAIVGLNDDDLGLQPDGDTADFFRSKDAQVMQGEKITNSGETLSFSNGKKLIISVSKVPMRNEDGKIIGVLGIAFDVTDM